MKIIRSKDFTAERAWGAMTVANMQGITTRLHWTDKPYKWHINEGEEVFAVLDGRVEMRYRDNCGQCSVMPCILATVIAPQARSAVKSLLRIIFMTVSIG